VQIGVKICLTYFEIFAKNKMKTQKMSLFLCESFTACFSRSLESPCFQDNQAPSLGATPKSRAYDQPCHY